MNKEIQFISFKLDGKDFGIEVDMIKEIRNVSEITPIPRSPDYLSGLMNLRGSIIPVLDPKKRLNLQAKGTDSIITDKTKILVIIIAGIYSGIIIDEISEVRRVNSTSIEPPPQAVLGIDKFFLTGIIKLQEEKKLILMLNLKELLNIEIQKIEKITTEQGQNTTNIEKQKIEEVQAVTFNLGQEEFGIEITNIKEILKVYEITNVPNVPDYVKGIQNIRDMIIPVIDMRKIVNMDSIEKSTKKMVNNFRSAHILWVKDLEASILDGKAFTKSSDPGKCELGIAMNSSKDNYYVIKELFSRFKVPHEKLHLSAIKILKILSINKNKALDIFNNETLYYRDILIELFDELDNVFEEKRLKEQRILIIEVNNIYLGLLVDRVFEVLRFPIDIVDTTPGIISTYGNEIKGVAKLNDGTRLIMMVDEKQLISIEDVNTISKIHETDKEIKSEKEDRVEKQYVIFSIEGEEYGVGIEKVQEIFKVNEITNVPRAPEFIKGITNLRGSIIPIIDIKKRFGIKDVSENNRKTDEKRSALNHKKILVVKLKDITVGLLVDNVNEVLKIYENLIVDAPALVVSHIDTSYLEGIAKLDNGNRIVLILEINNLMSEKDFNKLIKIDKPKIKKTNDNNKNKENTSKNKITSKTKTVKKNELINRLKIDD